MNTYCICGGEKRRWSTSGTQPNSQHCEKRGHTYISLDHLTALGSDPGDEAKHVHLPLRDHHVQHSINHNEGARPPHTSTDRETKLELKVSAQNDTFQWLFLCLPAMYHNGSSILGVAILHFFQELEHANRSERHPKIWPAGKVELGNKPLRFLSRHVSHLKHNQVRSKHHLQPVRGHRKHLKCIPGLQESNSNLGHLELIRRIAALRSYLLYAEFAYGVVHQYHCVFYRHTDVPVSPTALVRPVLGTFALRNKRLITRTEPEFHHEMNHFNSSAITCCNRTSWKWQFLLHTAPTNQTNIHQILFASLVFFFYLFELQDMQMCRIAAFLRTW